MMTLPALTALPSLESDPHTAVAAGVAAVSPKASGGPRTPATAVSELQVLAAAHLAAMLTVVVTCLVELARTRDAQAKARGERGDVPGWVLITVMTAGLVLVIWGLAKDQLTSIFQDAISSVKAPK